jgi:hypothetical protein
LEIRKYFFYTYLLIMTFNFFLSTHDRSKCPPELLLINILPLFMTKNMVKTPQCADTKQTHCCHSVLWVYGV